jgi:phosphoserine phosphatase
MKIIALDVEGTIFKTKIKLPSTNIDSTIWQSIALSLGPKAVQEEIDTHVKWEAGLYNNYMEWMKETILIHKKYELKESDFKNIINSAEYNHGVIEFFNALDRKKYIPVLITGGFQELAKRVQVDFNINHSFAACQYYFDMNGLLSGYNLLPCDFHGKVEFIEIMLKEYGLSNNDWIFIGDGKNDIEIAKKSPFSVGICAHSELKKVVNLEIESFKDLINVIL